MCVRKNKSMVLNIFLIPAPEIMKPIFKKLILKIINNEKRIPKMYTFTYLALLLSS